MINSLEEELLNFRGRPDIIVKKIEATFEICDDLTELNNFNLASREKYEHSGFRGFFHAVPVHAVRVDGYNIDIVKKEDVCLDCHSERLYDEVYNEFYCPKCDADLTWVQKKRRKIFKLMRKL